MVMAQSATPESTQAPSSTEPPSSAEVVEADSRVKLAQSIQSELSAQSHQLALQLESLSLVKTTSFGGECMNARAYDSASVGKVHERIRTRALGRFSAPAAAAAKAELERTFPKRPTPEKSVCFGSTPTYSEAQVSTLWERLAQWFKGTEKFSLLIDVTVQSNTRAEAKLSPAAGDGSLIHGPRWTESRFPKLFRGIYRVSTLANGYKPFNGEISLVDDDAPTIQCELVKVAEQGESRCALMP